MIVAEQKPIQEIADMVKSFDKILILGCGGCVSVCLSGGEKEVGVMASALKMFVKTQQNRDIEITELTIARQCDWEYFDMVKDAIAGVDAVVCIGCGAGVQGLVEAYPDALVFPGLNTGGLSVGKVPGVWEERCAGCGNCILHLTGGLCPIARCSKHILNGPCGGSEKGMCEVDPSRIECVWHLIYERLKKLGQLDNIYKVMDMKDWRTAADGGVRFLSREDMSKLDAAAEHENNVALEQKAAQAAKA